MGTAARDYAELDAAIIDHIQKGFSTAPANSVYCNRVAGEIAPSCISWRLVDRRVQWLRKNGFIRHCRKQGWIALKALAGGDTP